MLIAASAIASNPTSMAKRVTNAPSFGITPLSMSWRKSNGVATIKAASTTTVKRKIQMLRRYGFANVKIRFTVPALSFCCLTDGSAVIDLWVIQAACIDM